MLAYLWMSANEYDDFANGRMSDTMFTSFIERLRVEPVPTADRLELPIEPVDQLRDGRILVIVQEPGHDFWATLLGHGDGNLRGVSEPIDLQAPRISVAVEVVRQHASQERCVGERLQLVVLDAPEVRGQLGSETQRRFCVMLPPSYLEQGERRYPVVYLLPGFGGTDTQYLHLAAARDAISASSGEEVILVGVDGRTAFGATYFIDTDIAGHWSRMLLRAVVEIDRRFRTHPGARTRGLLGHSTGGFNAISLVLRHSDVFGAAGASSPDGLDLERWLFEEGRTRPLWLTWSRLENQLGGPGQMLSYAVQFGDTQRWPFDLVTGSRAEVWETWRRQSPLVLLEELPDASRRGLDDRIFIEVGRRDAFDLHAPAEAFHQRLLQLGIEHEFVASDAGHFDGSRERRERALSYLIPRLSVQSSAYSSENPASATSPAASRLDALEVGVDVVERKAYSARFELQLSSEEMR